MLLLSQQTARRNGFPAGCTSCSNRFLLAYIFDLESDRRSVVWNRGSGCFLYILIPMPVIIRTYRSQKHNVTGKTPRSNHVHPIRSVTASARDRPRLFHPSLRSELFFPRSGLLAKSNGTDVLCTTPSSLALGAPRDGRLSNCYRLRSGTVLDIPDPSAASEPVEGDAVITSIPGIMLGNFDCPSRPHSACRC